MGGFDGVQYVEIIGFEKERVSSATGSVQSCGFGATIAVFQRSITGSCLEAGIAALVETEQTGEFIPTINIGKLRHVMRKTNFEYTP